MLDTNRSTIMTDWKPQHERLFGTVPLKLGHSLHLQPLFSDEKLVALLETAQRGDYHVNIQDGERRREGQFGGLSGEQILEIVRSKRVWINFKPALTEDSPYGRLLNDIYDEFENRVPGLVTFKRGLTLLVSSPNISVKYHVDVPGQTLWQLRGQKRVYVYPNQEPFVSRAALQNLVRGQMHETDMQFEPWFDDHAWIYDLNPGEMLHWPHNYPHRVENADCMNVSLTTEHWTGPLRNVYACHYANGVAAQAGIRSDRLAQSGPALWSRLALAGLVKKSPLGRRAAKPYSVDFELCVDSETGIRDIEPVTFRHG
ncbi:MAG: cupin-like domain-containing protein [Pseudomonadota bacterium]